MTTIRLDKFLKSALSEVAKFENRSFSDVCRFILKLGLAEYRRLRATQEDK